VYHSISTFNRKEYDMRMHLIVVMLFVSLAAGCAHSKNGPDLNRVRENLDVTYEVMVLPGGHGSGIVIHEDGYMLTNHHVCGNGDRELRVTVSENGGKAVRLKARVFVYDAKYDLCVVKVEHRFRNPVIFENIDNVHPGDAVYNIGYPYGFGKLVNTGSVAAKAWNNARFRTTNGLVLDMEFIHPGSSGSGVYLVRSGKLIGLVRMIAWRQDMRGFTMLPRMTVKICVAVDDIGRFLDKYHIPYHKDRDPNKNWSVPASGNPPSGYQIEIIQVKPTQGPVVP